MEESRIKRDFDPKNSSSCFRIEIRGSKRGGGKIWYQMKLH